MISVIEEHNPTVYSVWCHQSLMHYYEGVPVASHTIKIQALEYAKENLQKEIQHIDTLIQNIHDNTTAKKLSPDNSSSGNK